MDAAEGVGVAAGVTGLPGGDCAEPLLACSVLCAGGALDPGALGGISDQCLYKEAMGRK